MAIPSLIIGSGKWATKQDKLLAYKQNTGGRYFAINGDTSRNSTATFTNQNGLIESVGNNVARVDFKDDVKGALLLEPQSTNLITQSESFGNSYWSKSGASIQGGGVDKVVNGDFATDTNWSKGTGWTISGGKANCDGTQTSSSDLEQQSTLEVNKNYEVIITVSNYISGQAYIVYGNTVNAGLIKSNGTFRRNLSVGGSLGNGKINIEANSSFTATIDNVSVKEVQGFASPSLDSPTGAFKLVEGANNGNHALSKGAIIPNNPNPVNYTISVFAKKKERQYLQLQYYTNGTLLSSSGFDLDNGTTLGNLDTHKIVDFGNGWYKCSFSAVISQSGGYNFVRVNAGLSVNAFYYLGDGTSGLYVFGAQLEQLPYATSYIPTNGSAVTRVQDGATNFGDVNTFNSEEGVLFFEGSSFYSLGSKRSISISDGSTSNYIQIQFQGVSRNLTILYISNGYISVNLNYLVPDNINNRKIAFLWASNRFELYVDGVRQLQQLSGDTNLFNLDSLKFSLPNDADKMLAKVKQVQVYKEALTDAELITLTTI